MDSEFNATSTRFRLLHQADRVMFLRSAVALPILLYPAIAGLPGGVPGVIAGVIVWFLLNDMNFLLHQHIHRPWTNSLFVNRTVDMVLSVVTGMSAWNWRLTHLHRHHKGDDSWGRGFAREISRPSFLGALSYSVRGIPIVYFCPFVASLIQGFAWRKQAECYYRWAFLEQLSVLMLAMILVLIMPGFYAPYYLCVVFFSRLTDYQNHVGCDENSGYGFSNNALSPCYNWVRYNFGYHTAHHYFPDAHWTELPGLHAQIVGKIPPERISKGCWTGLCTPPLIAYLVRSLFSGILSGRRAEHVQIPVSEKKTKDS